MDGDDAMLKLERHQKIVEYVNEYGAATVDDLAVPETQASLQPFAGT